MTNNINLALMMYFHGSVSSTGINSVSDNFNIKMSSARLSNKLITLLEYSDRIAPVIAKVSMINFHITRFSENEITEQEVVSLIVDIINMYDETDKINSVEKMLVLYVLCYGQTSECRDLLYLFSGKLDDAAELLFVDLNSDYNSEYHCVVDGYKSYQDKPIKLDNVLHRLITKLRVRYLPYKYFIKYPNVFLDVLTEKMNSSDANLIDEYNTIIRLLLKKLNR